MKKHWKAIIIAVISVGVAGVLIWIGIDVWDGATLSADECSLKAKYMAERVMDDINRERMEIRSRHRLLQELRNSQYKVTVTESVRGAIISKPGDNVVKLGSDFDFTVSTLAADASKVVVKVDGTTLKPTNGKYVIQDVKKNTTVTVSLPNPTPLKVEVQKDYAKAHVLGLFRQGWEHHALILLVPVFARPLKTSCHVLSLILLTCMQCPFCLLKPRA